MDTDTNRLFAIFVNGSVLQDIVREKGPGSAVEKAVMAQAAPGDDFHTLIEGDEFQVFRIKQAHESEACEFYARTSAEAVEKISDSEWTFTSEDFE